MANQTQWLARRRVPAGQRAATTQQGLPMAAGWHPMQTAAGAHWAARAGWHPTQTAAGAHWAARAG
ncbi:MAG: hypothetical protein WCG26_07085, partial [Chloroflexales bacterium]